MNFPDGIHQLDRERYDRLERVNWSTLKWMARSPAHYRHALTDSFRDTDAKQRGRAVHLAVFEPEVFRSTVVRWDGGTRRGKEWDKFCARNGDSEILTEGAYDAVMELAVAVGADPVAVPFLTGGKPEQSMLWTYKAPDFEQLPGYQISCKGRVDFIATEAGALVDLKTTRDASLDGFAREVWRYRYDAQAAYYVDGHEALTGKRLPYVLVAVEEAPPHAVAVYRLPEVVLETGREHYRALMDRLALCRAENRWPGYHEQVAELELPRWASAWGGEEDLSGLGLVVGGS
jgi:exodeoxyribonuclease VIII